MFVTNLVLPKCCQYTNTKLWVYFRKSHYSIIYYFQLQVCKLKFYFTVTYLTNEYIRLFMIILFYFAAGIRQIP